MAGSQREPDAPVTSGEISWNIVGQGLAGTCLAWEFWKRGVSFSIADEECGGSSRVAAGLINPVTGKNFEPSKHIADFLPAALGFYAQVEAQLGATFWHPLPVLRLANTEKEWRKIQSKLEKPEVARWLAQPNQSIAVAGWAGALEITGGGRLDTRAFLDASREFFRQRGIYHQARVSAEFPSKNRIWCEGAAGLITRRYGPHQSAKGEILTIRATGWDESRIRIGAGGWLVPIGNGCFKAGSTYDWDMLDELPTLHGKNRVTEIIHRLGGADFELLKHDAGIRPILRESEPRIGPIGQDGWMFNGLGSKGTLYAPGMASRLARWLIEGITPEATFDIRNFLNPTNP